MRREFYISAMLKRFPMAHWFLFGGGTLALLGLVLWVTLPVKSTLPPYFITPLLAFGYGLFCLTRDRQAENRKRSHAILRMNSKGHEKSK